jgi:hypothetical protein
MWIAYGLPAICPRFRGEFAHAAVRNHRDIPSHPHSGRSIATSGRCATARLRHRAGDRARDRRGRVSTNACTATCVVKGARVSMRASAAQQLVFDDRGRARRRARRGRRRRLKFRVFALSHASGGWHGQFQTARWGRKRLRTLICDGTSLRQRTDYNELTALLLRERGCIICTRKETRL